MLNVRYDKYYPWGEIVKMEGTFKSKKAFEEWKAKHQDIVVLETKKVLKRGGF